MRNNNNPVLGVGAVVFHNDRVLLVKRKNPPNQDQWCIPGGKVQTGESLKQAAEREILEETGITIRAGDPVYCFEIIDADDHNYVRYHYVVIDLVAEYVSGEPKASDDASHAAWIDHETFLKLDVNETTRALLMEKYKFPRDRNF